MIGKNKGICHSCRQPGHYLSTCPKKQRCPVCVNDFVKWMKVEKKSANIGRLFFCCSSNCGNFKWSDDNLNSDYDVGESSSVASGSSTAKDEIEELSRIFKIFAQITERQDVEISVNVIIHKGKGSTDENNKGKDKTEMN
ncbi:DNA-directed RNA polymerase 1B [Forsythia ovata]|uniref:DNA-directed RNA polymerase 1B n=1 Tax=Forsythia ovata TaxID=205694 RepID=A0ABD1P5G6_9LAMI